MSSMSLEEVGMALRLVRESAERLGNSDPNLQKVESILHRVALRERDDLRDELSRWIGTQRRG
tara:strand:+ start:137 stop:325 length:189 start_codon:yes stop_codon:yes gene_type:complete